MNTRLQYYFSIFDMKGEGVMIRPAFLDFINAVFVLFRKKGGLIV